MTVLKRDHLFFPYLPFQLQQNEDFVLENIDNIYSQYKYLPEILKKDKKIISKAIRFDSETFLAAPNDIRHDKQFILKQINYCPDIIEFIPDELKKDKHFMLAAVRKDWETFKYAPYEIRDDSDFVLKAAKENSQHLKYASERLKNDELFVRLLIMLSPLCYKYASDKIRSKRDLAKTAAELNNENLFFCPEKLRFNRTFFRSIKQESCNVQSMSDEMKNDIDFLLSLYNCRSISVLNLPDRIKNDRFFIDCLLNTDKLESFNEVSEDMKNDKLFIMQELKKHAYIFQYISDRLKNDSDIIELAMEKSTLTYVHLPLSEQIKVKNITAFLKEFPHAVAMLPAEILSNKQLLERIKQDNKSIVDYLV